MSKPWTLMLAWLLATSIGCESPNWGRSLLESVTDVFDGSESFAEERAEEASQRQSDAAWKGFWRDNPTVNPKMTEAFANE